MNQLKNKNLILVIVIFITFFLRFYKLEQNPPGLYVDEVSLGYNAYSILKTGKDEYGNFLPLFFRSFNTYNPAFSVYTLVPSVAIFGLNEFAIRFPSVLLGSISILLTYLLVNKLFKNKNLSLAASFLFAISPWHLHFSRFYHEANLMIFFSLLGLVLFFYSKNRPFFLMSSATVFGISLNTSHSAKLWVPLFLIIIAWYFKKEIRKLGKKLVYPILILAIFTIPIILNFQKTLIRPVSVSIFNQKGDVIENLVSSYLSHFSPNFLFIRGDYFGRHSVPGMGELYVFELPLIVLGLIKLIRQNDRPSKFLLTWLLIAPIPASLATPTPHAGRSLTFLPTWSIIAAVGLNNLLSLKIRQYLKGIFITGLLAVAVYNIITYFHLYYKHYPKEKAIDWSDGHKEMAKYVGSVYDNYERIVITKYWGHPYIYLLFYLKYDPKKYHSQSENKNAFDKFEFFLGTPEESFKKTLSISTPENKKNVLKEFKMNNGDTIFVAHE